MNPAKGDRASNRDLPERLLGGAGLLALMAALIVTVVLSESYSREYYRHVVDDALTSMQYAKNLALGNGVVFNVGERVEGYTNFLWVVFMAPIYSLSKALDTEFVPLMVHVNVALAALILVLTYALGRKLWANNLVATCVALAVCVVDNSYTVWAVLGLEGHFLAVWMLVSLLLASSTLKHRGPLIGLSLTAAHMTRPDAGLFAAMLIATLGASWLLALRRGLPKDEQRERLKVAVAALGTWLGVYGVYFLWRYNYYGWFFPNTYYLKVGAGDLNAWGRGFGYLYSFFRERWFVPAIAILGLLSPTLIGRAVVLYLAAHTLYIAYVGGDFFPGHRFFVPQIPLFGIACGLAVHPLTRLLNRGRFRSAFADRPWTAVALALAALAPVFYKLYLAGRAVGPLAGEIYSWRDNLSMRRDLMRWLAVHKPANATLSTGGIGAAGFYGDMRRVVDMVGILDPVVAHRPVANFGRGHAGHEKWATVPEILAQKPTYIEMGYMTDDWGDQYYLDASMRLALQKRLDGIWRRDDLVETGRYLLESAVHFSPGPYEMWAASGSAFESWPTSPAGSLGAIGSCIDTRSAALGDAATGQLMSPEFDLVGDVMVLRVGGGLDAERLRVSLWVDGQRVFSETGLESEHLSRRTWSIAPYRGKRGRIEIVDDSTGPWGHILVDEILQWQKSS
ncbi:MAG TPA: hypothetical protein VI072_32870 [Polyangiaceae bacterium]